MVGKLDLSFSNHPLWRGCKIRRLSNGRYHLQSPSHGAAAVLKENLATPFLAFINQGIDTLEITGAVPSWVYLVVLACAVEYFRNIRYSDEKMVMVIVGK